MVQYVRRAVEMFVWEVGQDALTLNLRVPESLQHPVGASRDRLKMS
jgi:hypothetical protein